MRLFDSLYKLHINDDIGNPDTLGLRFDSVDARVDALEGVRIDWEEAIAAITATGLARIDAVLKPVAEHLLSALDVGLFFTAHSPTEALVGLGRLSLFVDESERGQYAPTAYVAIMPSDTTSPAMMGAVVLFSRSTGELVVDVDQVSGAGVHAGWTITPTSPVDNAAIAAEAATSAAASAASAVAAISARGTASSEASIAMGAATAAAASANVATAAELVAAEARDVTLAAVAEYNLLWLGAHASDPLTDNVGNPLTLGSAYANTNDNQLRYYLEGGWTTMVVPIGSEVLSIFGRTGTVGPSLGDYNTGQVSRSPVGGIAGATAEAALLDLKAQVDAKLPAAAASAFALTLIDDADAATARATLGLGSIATHAAGDFAVSGHGHAWADITSGVPTTLAGFGVTDAYTKAAVDGAIAAVVGGAPVALSTLDALSAAIGDDPSFFSTMVALIGGKLSNSAVSTFALTLLADSTAAGARSTLGAAATVHAHAIADVTNLQTALDAKIASTATLAAMAGVGMAADRAIYFTGPGAASAMPVTSFARSVLDDADAATVRTTLGLRIGTDVQAQDATLASIALLGTGADKILYTTGPDTWAEAVLTAFGRSLIAAASSSAAQGIIGGQFPAGTAIVFGAAPPTGWVARGDLNDRGLRISSATVGAAGGVIGFASVFSRTTTDGHALVDAENGPHAHGAGSLKAQGYVNSGGTTGIVAGYDNGQTLRNMNITGATASAGSGVAHTHPMDIRLAYFDVAIGVKS